MHKAKRIDIRLVKCVDMNGELMESYRRLNTDHDCSLDSRIFAVLRACIALKEF